MCRQSYETPALPPELRRLGRNFAQLQGGILARPGAGVDRIVPGDAIAGAVDRGTRARQDASEDAAERAGSTRSTAWRRSAAETGFMRTGAARRMRKFAYSGV
jgi:hypothetical protein